MPPQQSQIDWEEELKNLNKQPGQGAPGQPAAPQQTLPTPAQQGAAPPVETPAQQKVNTAQTPAIDWGAEAYPAEHRPTGQLVVPPQRGGYGQWLNDLESDVKFGTGKTAPGRALRFFGAPGLDVGGQQGVSHVMGGALMGPVDVAQGLYQSGDPRAGTQARLGGVNRMVTGGMETAGAALPFMKGGGLLPSIVPTLATYGPIQAGVQAGAQKLGATPEEAELAGNIAMFGAPAAKPALDMFGNVVRGTAPAVGTGAGWLAGKAVRRVPIAGRFLEKPVRNFVSGAVADRANAYGGGISAIGRTPLLPHELFEAPQPPNPLIQGPFARTPAEQAPLRRYMGMGPGRFPTEQPQLPPPGPGPLGEQPRLGRGNIITPPPEGSIPVETPQYFTKEGWPIQPPAVNIPPTEPPRAQVNTGTTAPTVITNRPEDFPPVPEKPTPPEQVDQSRRNFLKRGAAAAVGGALPKGGITGDLINTALGAATGGEAAPTEPLTNHLPVLNTIGKSFGAIQSALIQEFGDPGHDIGDMDNPLDLMGSLTTLDEMSRIPEAHSYGLEDFDLNRALGIVSRISGVPMDKLTSMSRSIAASSPDEATDVYHKQDDLPPEEYAEQPPEQGGQPAEEPQGGTPPGQPPGGGNLIQVPGEGRPPKDIEERGLQQELRETLPDRRPKFTGRTAHWGENPFGPMREGPQVPPSGIPPTQGGGGNLIDIGEHPFDKLPQDHKDMELHESAIDFLQKNGTISQREMDRLDETNDKEGYPNQDELLDTAKKLGWDPESKEVKDQMYEGYKGFRETPLTEEEQAHHQEVLNKLKGQQELENMVGVGKDIKDTFEKIQNKPEGPQNKEDLIKTLEDENKKLSPAEQTIADKLEHEPGGVDWDTEMQDLFNDTVPNLIDTPEKFQKGLEDILHHLESLNDDLSATQKEAEGEKPGGIDWDAEMQKLLSDKAGPPAKSPEEIAAKNRQDAIDYMSKYATPQELEEHEMMGGDLEKLARQNGWTPEGEKPPEGPQLSSEDLDKLGLPRGGGKGFEGPLGGDMVDRALEFLTNLGFDASDLYDFYGRNGGDEVVKQAVNHGWDPEKPNPFQELPEEEKWWKNKDRGLIDTGGVAEGQIPVNKDPNVNSALQYLYRNGFSSLDLAKIANVHSGDEILDIARNHGWKGPGGTEKPAGPQSAEDFLRTHGYTDKDIRDLGHMVTQEAEDLGWQIGQINEPPPETPEESKAMDEYARGREGEGGETAKFGEEKPERTPEDLERAKKFLRKTGYDRDTIDETLEEFGPDAIFEMADEHGWDPNDKTPLEPKGREPTDEELQAIMDALTENRRPAKDLIPEAEKSADEQSAYNFLRNQGFDHESLERVLDQEGSLIDFAKEEGWTGEEGEDLIKLFEGEQAKEPLVQETGKEKPGELSRVDQALRFLMAEHNYDIAQLRDLMDKGGNQGVIDQAEKLGWSEENYNPETGEWRENEGPGTGFTPLIDTSIKAADEALAKSKKGAEELHNIVNPQPSGSLTQFLWSKGLDGPSQARLWDEMSPEDRAQAEEFAKGNEIQQLYDLLKDQPEFKDWEEKGLQQEFRQNLEAGPGRRGGENPFGPMNVSVSGGAPDMSRRSFLKKMFAAAGAQAVPKGGITGDLINTALGAVTGGAIGSAHPAASVLQIIGKSMLTHSGFGPDMDPKVWKVMGLTPEQIASGNYTAEQLEKARHALNDLEDMEPAVSGNNFGRNVDVPGIGEIEVQDNGFDYNIGHPESALGILEHLIKSKSPQEAIETLRNHSDWEWMQHLSLPEEFLTDGGRIEKVTGYNPAFNEYPPGSEAAEKSAASEAEEEAAQERIDDAASHVEEQGFDSSEMNDEELIEKAKQTGWKDPRESKPLINTGVLGKDWEEKALQQEFRQKAGRRRPWGPEHPYGKGSE